jgi:hypothetical protein
MSAKPAPKKSWLARLGRTGSNHSTASQPDPGIEMSKEAKAATMKTLTKIKKESTHSIQTPPQKDKKESIVSASSVRSDVDDDPHANIEVAQVNGLDSFMMVCLAGTSSHHCLHRVVCLTFFLLLFFFPLWVLFLFHSFFSLVFSSFSSRPYFENV